MKKYLFILCFTISYVANAEISVYQDTDNTGQNKLERIGVIEKYLIDLSTSLKKMENKLDENSNKLKTLETVVKTLREEEIKKIREQLGEKKADNKDSGELEKVKADLLTLKNEDIEKLKTDVQGLNNIIKSLQSIMQGQLK